MCMCMCVGMCMMCRYVFGTCCVCGVCVLCVWCVCGVCVVVCGVCARVCVQHFVTYYRVILMILTLQIGRKCTYFNQAKFVTTQKILSCENFFWGCHVFYLLFKICTNIFVTLFAVWCSVLVVFCIGGILFIFANISRIFYFVICRGVSISLVSKEM